MSEPAKPDVPPRRYIEKDGWQHTIQDEQEWLARPARWGIEHLPEPVRTRKVLLFDHHFYGRIAGWIACAVCRPLVQEAFAEDGIRVPRDNFDYDICLKKFQTWYSAHHPGGPCVAWNSLRYMNFYECGQLTPTELHNSLINNLADLTRQLDHEGRTHVHHTTRTEWERQLALEIVGPNPFRPITFDPSWLTSNSIDLARWMYENSDFSTMPILADALQDVGCDHVEVLEHCRGPGPHVRGCWVVDAVLYKQ